VVALGVGVGTPAASASTHQHNCGEDHTAAASPQVRAVLAEISCTVADLRPIPALRDSSSTHLTCAPCHSGTLVWAGGSADCKLLVVIDQFEQLVTQTEDVTRELFVRALKPALGKKVQVVGTLRPEFLTTVLHDDNLSELDFNLYPIAPLKKAALIEIIRKPAERADIDIPSALAATMARDTMGASKSGEVLPLLAFTLAELTSDRAPGEKGFKVTARAYKDFGGIHGAIAKKADEALNDIRTQRVASADDTVETLVKLVQVRAAGPTKNLVDENELNDSDKRILGFFRARHLVTREPIIEGADGAKEKFVYSIVHEALLDRWQILRDEIEKQKISKAIATMVDEDAQKWIERGKDKARLYSGDELAKTLHDLGLSSQSFLASGVQPARPSRPARCSHECGFAAVPREQHQKGQPSAGESSGLRCRGTEDHWRTSHLGRHVCPYGHRRERPRGRAASRRSDHAPGIRRHGEIEPAQR
jgi:hypothetical protein